MSHDHDRKSPEKARRSTEPKQEPDARFQAAADSRYGSILNLQALVGNQVVQRLVKDRSPFIPQVSSINSSGPDINREDENIEAAQEHFEAGQRLFRAGQYAAAATRLERARQVPGLSDDTYSTLLYDLGVCNLRLERFATAVTYFEQYLEQPGANAEEVEPLLEQARTGTAGDAERIMSREGGELPPESADAEEQTVAARTLFEQASALYSEGQYRQAIIIFEQVREMEITEGGEEIHTAVLFNIGRCNFRLRRFSTAIIYLEQYIDRAPSEADRDEAQEMLTEAQEEAGTLTSQEQGEMMLRLANEAYEAGEYASALQRFKTLLELRGLNEEAQSQIEYNLGMCYFRLGRLADARAAIERYLADHPGDSEAQSRLDEIVQQMGSE